MKKKGWATADLQFRGKNRGGDQGVKARIGLADRRPLFSSFTDDNMYHYGPTAEVLEKIEEELYEQGEANLAAVR